MLYTAPWALTHRGASHRESYSGWKALCAVIGMPPAQLRCRLGSLVPSRHALFNSPFAGIGK